MLEYDYYNILSDTVFNIKNIKNIIEHPTKVQGKNEEEINKEIIKTFN